MALQFWTTETEAELGRIECSTARWQEVDYKYIKGAGSNICK